jgi:hypothetical protein
MVMDGTLINLRLVEVRHLIEFGRSLSPMLSLFIVGGLAWQVPLGGMLTQRGSAVRTHSHPRLDAADALDSPESELDSALSNLHLSPETMEILGKCKKKEGPPPAPFATPKKLDSTPITADEVNALQSAWANAIKAISADYLAAADYVSTASEAAGELYGYGHVPVLFKPAKAAQHPFRSNGAEAISYFVGCESVENGYAGV